MKYYKFLAGLFEEVETLSNNPIYSEDEVRSAINYDGWASSIDGVIIPADAFHDVGPDSLAIVGSLFVNKIYCIEYKPLASELPDLTKLTLSKDNTIAFLRSIGSSDDDIKSSMGWIDAIDGLQVYAFQFTSNGLGRALVHNGVGYRPILLELSMVADYGNAH